MCAIHKTVKRSNSSTGCWHKTRKRHYWEKSQFLETDIHTIYPDYSILIIQAADVRFTTRLPAIPLLSTLSVRHPDVLRSGIPSA